MTCPNCGSDKTIRDEIDDSLYCPECGTLLEENQFRDLFPDQENEPVSKVAKRDDKKDPSSRFLSVFFNFATFFKIPEGQVAHGDCIIKDVASELDKYYKNEAALCVIYVVNRTSRPNWRLQDYYEICPVSLDYKHVVKSYQVIAKKYTYLDPLVWRKPQEEVDNYVDCIYPIIKKQIYGQARSHKHFSRSQLKSRTRELIDLGDLYFINTGKKTRPVIIIAALLSGLSFFVEGKDANRITSKKVSCYRKFKFSAFSSHCSAHYQTFLYYYSDYLRLLTVCLQYIPWVKEKRKQFVHYYLTDILQLFGSKDKKKPTITLSDDQLSACAYMKNAQARERLEKIMDKAEYYIKRNITPNNTKSLFYCIYKVLLHGYPRRDIQNWSVGYIRSLAHIITLRKDDEQRIVAHMDLDRTEVDENDMSDTEIELYLEQTYI